MTMIPENCTPHTKPYPHHTPNPTHGAHNPIERLHPCRRAYRNMLDMLRYLLRRMSLKLRDFCHLKEDR